MEGLLVEGQANYRLFLSAYIFQSSYLLHQLSLEKLAHRPFMKNNSRRFKPTKKQLRLPPLEEDLILAPSQDSLLIQSDDSFSIDSLASFQIPRGLKKEEESVILSDFDASATLQSVDVLSLAGLVVKNEENPLEFSSVKAEDYDDKFQIHELPLDSSLSPTSTDYPEQTTLRNINHLTIKAELSALNISIANDKELNWQELNLQGADEREIMERLRREMKGIDEEVRTLTSKKNKLKYLLRKQEGTLGEGEGEPEPTKQCPCCNKDISKLCFRCEHTYCEPEQCARKKKQLLNARMLSKMKEKKGSKKEQLKDKKGKKIREKALPMVQEESESSVDSYSSNSYSRSIQSSTESKSQRKVQDLPVIKEETKEEPSSSFSDINTNSFLNFSLSVPAANNSYLYFEQQSTR